MSEAFGLRGSQECIGMYVAWMIESTEPETLYEEVPR
jgi:hypothetical protein